jgi:hypothetical protein
MQALTAPVEALHAKDPQGYASTNATKRLAGIIVLPCANGEDTRRARGKRKRRLPHVS